MKLGMKPFLRKIFLKKKKEIDKGPEVYCHLPWLNSLYVVVKIAFVPNLTFIPEICSVVRKVHGEITIRR